MQLLSHTREAATITLTTTELYRIINSLFTEEQIQLAKGYRASAHSTQEFRDTIYALAETMRTLPELCPITGYELEFCPCRNCDPEQ